MHVSLSSRHRSRQNPRDLRRWAGLNQGFVLRQCARHGASGCRTRLGSAGHSWGGRHGHANCFFSVLFLRKSSGNTDSDDVPGWNAFDQPNAAPRGPQCVGNDGIDWRGTHYPLRQPRADQRVKFFGSTGSRPKFSEGYCLLQQQCRKRHSVCHRGLQSL